MSYQSRRILTPGPTRKRKEMEPLLSSPSPKPSTAVARAVAFTSHAANKGAEQQPASNRLLAGYMAHEFLTKGTMFGQRFDPARAEASPVNAAGEVKRKRLSQASKEAEPKPKPKPESYAEVANLVKSKGTHIPGIVNPTQLAKWIQM